MQPKAVMSVQDVSDFLDREFPQIHLGGRTISVCAIDDGSATIRFEPDDRHLRPGGTISGPALFALADIAAYVVILAHIGPVALAVTTNLNINFLRKPADGTALSGLARLLKLGKRLAVVDIAISDDTGTLVAHATATYSIPPQSLEVK